MAVPRLHLDHDLATGAEIALDEGQARYLVQVMRLKAGDGVRVFNAESGEWRARLSGAGRKGARLAIEERTRAPQRLSADLHLLFAPVKRTRTDFIVEKATELGVSAIRPVFTQRTVAERVRLDRLEAIAREAAEQSERLDLPQVREAEKLDVALDGWAEKEGGRKLLFLDEASGGEGSPWRETDQDAPPALAALAGHPKGPWAVLIGPEGGFTPEERARLRSESFVVTASLGPRILRADTAAIAALTLWQAVLGDWG
ncbi:MAG: 16S rRNA (uracil(1498)-N(3))-methyltransferase [Maricaulaceae bacterium]|jgi:16S rRNA (uracil1498-N3)-methyltransferase